MAKKIERSLDRDRVGLDLQQLVDRFELLVDLSRRLGVALTERADHGLHLGPGDVGVHTDTADATDLDPRIQSLRVPRPATLLLCSDGLWNYAPTTQALAKRIEEQGAQSSNLALARALTDFARDAGGHDNITVAIADL